MKDSWQPAETAPKDGTEILVWMSEDASGPMVASWDKSFGWMDTARGSCWGFGISHWQPIQAPEGIEYIPPVFP